MFAVLFLVDAGAYQFINSINVMNIGPITGRSCVVAVCLNSLYFLNMEHSHLKQILSWNVSQPSREAKLPMLFKRMQCMIMQQIYTLKTLEIYDQ